MESNCPCPLSRDYWSRFTHGNITKYGAVIELDVVELDVVKTKASDGGFICSNFIWTGLISGHLTIVDCLEENSRNIWPRECVSDNVIFSTDMVDACERLTDEKHVSSLTG